MVFKNRYLDLGEGFYQKTPPEPVANPAMIIFNRELAAEFAGSLNEFDDLTLVEMFSGNRVHNSCEPLAMAYAGHQFGQFNPQLGDGRAIYLGELERVHASTSSFTMDVQLKGSGPTEYSRSGDGRAALGPVLREYLVSEAMHKLNVPTTRALAATTTGEKVARDKFLPGGVITRVASSFIRVGSFQYFAAQEDLAAIQKLADYVIERNYSDLKQKDNPYPGLLEAVVERQAKLIAQWMQLGFIHGVMNTDNMSVAGETIDYGPCAFMDTYRHAQVYSYIDRMGRYAYNQQPSIGMWNLTRLAETLLRLFDDDTDAAVEIAKSILQKYFTVYEDAWLTGMRAKCGLTAVGDKEHDKTLLESLFNIMADNSADFTLTFYTLSQLDAQANEKDISLRELFASPQAIDAWLIRWRERLATETQSDSERQSQMQSVNPVYIPRNHQIEAVIRAAEDRNDFAPFHALHEVLQNPFQYQPGKDAYMLPPKPEEEIENTFCGT